MATPNLSQPPPPTLANDVLSEDWQAEIVPPDISHLITEDDTPVDNLIQEKQQRLLVDSLYSSFQPEDSFLATANVGLFYGLKQPPLVPDAMISLGVTVPEDWTRKEGRSYFVWEFGKRPAVAIEIVSKSEELGQKLKDYAQAGLAYYVVFDPLQQITTETVQVYELQGGQYYLLGTPWMSGVGLGLVCQNGEYEGKEFTWLRWHDQAGNILLTGNERANQESQRAEQEHQRAEQERQRADQLAELLRAQGLNPDELLGS